MVRRSRMILGLIVALLALAVCAIVYPVAGREGFRLGLDLKGGIYILYKADLSAVEPGEESDIMDGVIAVIMNRINPLGVTEPVIERQGKDRILVQLPEASVTDVQKERIGRTALLEFRELVTNEDGEEEWIPAVGTIDGEERVLNSSYFKENTYVTVSDLSGVLLIFEWNEEGSKLSEEITGRLIDKPLGIFEGDEPLLGDDGQPIAPIVRSQITTSGQIEGLSLNEAEELSSQLNAGRLPVALETIYEQTISPVLGADFVDLSIKAGIIGLLLVIIFMCIYYRISGAMSAIALAFYAAVVLAIFKLIPVTLTLAGIGGFILSVGMAVDANVLIFERMKEELRMGRTLGAAIEVGFNRAWNAIRDSNITTFIVCLVLYVVGSNVVAGATVKGFAVTLFIGVAISMFTAIVVTRTLLRMLVGTSLVRKTHLFRPYLGRE